MEHMVLLIFSFLVEAVIIWQYSSGLFAPGRSKKSRMIFIGIFYVILFFVAMAGKVWLNIILYFLVNAMFLYTQFKIDIMLAIFHSAIVTTIMGSSEFAVFTLTSWFIPHFLDNAKSGLFIYTLFSKILLFTIINLLLNFFRKTSSRQEDYKENTNFALMLIPVSSIFIMVTFFSIGEKFALTTQMNSMITLSAVFLLGINLIVFGINQYNHQRNI